MRSATLRTEYLNAFLAESQIVFTAVAGALDLSVILKLLYKKAHCIVYGGIGQRLGEDLVGLYAARVADR